MKKILLLGSVGCGKTTLMQRLKNLEIDYHKTQFVHDDGEFIDTPGEYLDLRHFRHALQLHSNVVDAVVFVHSATESRLRLPPGFVSYFTKPVIGVVSKTDIADTEGIERAERYLRLAGITKIFKLSSITGDGVDELVEFLES